VIAGIGVVNAAGTSTTQAKPAGGSCCGGKSKTVALASAADAAEDSEHPSTVKSCCSSKTSGREPTRSPPARAVRHDGRLCCGGKAKDTAVAAAGGKSCACGSGKSGATAGKSCCGGKAQGRRFGNRQHCGRQNCTDR